MAPKLVAGPLLLIHFAREPFFTTFRHVLTLIAVNAIENRMRNDGYMCDRH